MVTLVFALLRASVGADVVIRIETRHHVGKTVQHTIAGSDSAILIGHLIMINLNIVTTVHTDLIIDRTTSNTQAIVGDWLIDGIDAFIQVIDRCAPEVDDSRHGCIQEDRAAARHTHGLVERIDAGLCRSREGSREEQDRRQDGKDMDSVVSHGLCC